MKKYFALFFLILCFVPLFSAHAQDGQVLQDKVAIVKAQVTEILVDEMRQVEGTDVNERFETFEAKILEGDNEGKTITLDDDYVGLNKGDVFYLNDTIRSDDGREVYSVSDPYRLPTLYFFGGLFVLLVVLVGGFQGIRGLLSLVGSFALILYVLLPGILHGYSPVLVSVAVSSLIIVLGSYITHGFNKTTSSAVLGMILTVIVTGALAYAAVHSAKLTGYAAEESIYVNFNSGGKIDIVGVLLGGIMIGLLGVLYDVAIGQAISVEELHSIAPHVSRKKIFARSLRIGREHIGALVNTLAIAYVGASLPLLILFSQTTTAPISQIVNREVFATEIIRALIGSIGLVIAVPITTLLAVLLLVKMKTAPDTATKEKESQAFEHFEHHH